VSNYGEIYAKAVADKAARQAEIDAAMGDIGLSMDEGIKMPAHRWPFADVARVIDLERRVTALEQAWVGALARMHGAKP
jgi:hypothetical protein